MSEHADFWTRWSGTRFPSDQFTDRFRLECALLDALGCRLPQEGSGALARAQAKGGADWMLASLRLGARVPATRGDALRALHFIPLLVAACLGGPRPQAPLPAVPVEGSDRDLRWLAGEWVGEFTSARDDRRGSIAFSLRGGRDTAQGRVVFTGPMQPPGCTDAVTAATEPRAAGEIVLTFARINVSDRTVGGWLRPYRDPELGCPMDTWFEGEAQGDTVSGMYFSHPADAAAALRLGTWWVTRRR